MVKHVCLVVNVYIEQQWKSSTVEWQTCVLCEWTITWHSITEHVRWETNPSLGFASCRQLYQLWEAVQKMVLFKWIELFNIQIFCCELDDKFSVSAEPGLIQQWLLSYPLHLERPWTDTSSRRDKLLDSLLNQYLKAATYIMRTFLREEHPPQHNP